jgi:hypothetical protein
MADEDNVFAMPPAEGGDAMPGDFAAPPAQEAYVGEVDETSPPMEETAEPTGGEEPILLGGAPPPEEGDVVDEAAAEAVAYEAPPEEPTGPSPMQKWNEEWQETLLQRKDAENAKKAELLEASKVAMETFTAQQEQKREQKMSKNRQDEQEKLEAIEADLENDNSWQKVCKMVELSHDSSENAADVGRMRDVLIHLKNDEAKAIELGA